MKAIRTLLAALAFALPVAAQASLFTFDDLSAGAHVFTPIPDGYGGAHFDGFAMRLVGELDYTGLNANDTSGVLAVGQGAAPSITFASPTLFSGLFLINPSGALSFDLMFQNSVVGSSGDVGILGRTYASPYQGPIDAIVFHQAANDAFSIDDLALAPAPISALPDLHDLPEPSALLLALAALAMLVVARRRPGAVLALLLASGAASAQVAIDDEAGSSFKGSKRVVIAQFGVEYYTQLTVIGRSGGNTATQVSKLVGVSDAVMQALVDKLYADTVARLKDAGFELLDQASLLADPGYQAFAAQFGKASPLVMHDTQGLGDGEHISKVFAPTGMPTFYASAGSSGGVVRGNMSDRFNAQNYGNAMKEAEIAKRLNATLLKFNFLANYGVTKASKNGLLANFAQTAARVSIETASVLQPYDTQVQWVDASGGRMFGNIRRAGATGAFYLDKPLQAASVFKVADTTADDTKQNDNVANAIFGLFGSKNARKTVAAEVVGDDASYASAFGPLLATAADALVDKLKNAR